jgi:hypothetical protein
LGREVLLLLAALSGLLIRLLTLLIRLLLTALSGLLVRLFTLILIGHSYLPFFGEVLIECHHSTKALKLSGNDDKARI